MINRIINNLSRFEVLSFIVSIDLFFLKNSKLKINLELLRT